MFIYQTEKRLKYYDKVIEIYKQTGYTAYRIAKMGLVPVGEDAIERWIANFVAESKEPPYTVMQKPQVTTPSQDTSADVEELRKRVRELETQLSQAEIRAEFYEEMIKVAEARFKIPIRKKAGAKQ